MGTARGLERLIFFTDAVTAIAITLLILPLVSIVPIHPAPNESVWPLLVDHASQLGSFVLSFLVIAKFWLTHHAIFEHVGRYNRRLSFLSLAWAFTIVVLPLPTAITAAYSSSSLTVGLYIGTVLLSSLTLTAITFTVRGNQHIESQTNPISRETLVSSVTSAASIALALVLALTIPRITYYGLLLLFLTTPINHFILRRLTRRNAAHTT